MRNVTLGILIVALVGLTAWGAFAEGEEPKRFASEEAAVEALVKAAEANDDAALTAIFGTKHADLVTSSKDPVAAAERKEFAKAVKERLVMEKLDDGKIELVIGDEAWPFPILLVPENDKWFFDVEEGKEEILARRIGRNELEAIDIMAAYDEAQRIYAAIDRDGDKVKEFAQKIVSTKGKRDGLWWPVDADDPDAELSPFGPAAITLGEYLQDVQEGKDRVPFNGYYWKVLTAQGPSAPGGEHSYIINGNMIAGFALVGVPARYRNTGVMSFMVSHHGEMFEKDLGEKGIDAVKAMTAFDPGDGWKVVNTAGEAPAEDE